jgi:hypothetical protein
MPALADASGVSVPIHPGRSRAYWKATDSASEAVIVDDKKSASL